MKRLILFKGGVETLEFFTEQMAAVWEKMGCSVFWYNLMLQQASSSALVEFFKAHSDFVIENNGSVNDTFQKTCEVIETIKERYNGG